MGYQPMQISDLNRAPEHSLAARLGCSKEGDSVHASGRALSKVQLIEV